MNKKLDRSLYILLFITFIFTAGHFMVPEEIAKWMRVIAFISALSMVILLVIEIIKDYKRSL